MPGLTVDRLTGFADVRRIRPELEGPTYRLPLRVQRFNDRRTLLLSLGRHSARPRVLATALAGLQGFGSNVIVETGPTPDLGSLGPLPPNVALGRMIDYSRALPLCTAVIGNASAELTVGAMSHGLPMVNLPGSADQLATAREISRIGAGITLQSDRLAPGGLRHALADLLVDPAYVTAARTQQAAIAALPSAAEVVSDLTATVPA